MRKRYSDYFLAFILLNAMLVGALMMHARVAADRPGAVAERQEIVRKFGLTDLCLFTEARYTRNPAISDISTPFQDGPASLDYFPSGSLFRPPPHLVKP